MSNPESNPEIGPRCGACRLGLASHEPLDPQCELFAPANLEETICGLVLERIDPLTEKSMLTAGEEGIIDLEQVAAHNDVLRRFDIADSTVSDNGKRILWADPEDPFNPYTVATSNYGDYEAGESGTAFLRSALPVLQASPALVEEIIRLRGALAAALHEAGAVVTEWGTAMKDESGELWDAWPHGGLNSGDVTVAEVEAELIADERPLVLVLRQIETAWTEYGSATPVARS